VRSCEVPIPGDVEIVEAKLAASLECPAQKKS
jgi:hypothetical protein